MMQWTHKHPPGSFHRCHSCKREPTHVETRGCPGIRHSLECIPCNQSTGRHETVAKASAQWSSMQSQVAIPERLRIAK